MNLSWDLPLGKAASYFPFPTSDLNPLFSGSFRDFYFGDEVRVTRVGGSVGYSEGRVKLWPRGSHGTPWPPSPSGLRSTPSAGGLPGRPAPQRSAQAPEGRFSSLRYFFLLADNAFVPFHAQLSFPPSISRCIANQLRFIFPDPPLINPFEEVSDRPTGQTPGEGTAFEGDAEAKATNRF